MILRSIFCVDYCKNADPITFTNVIFSEEIAVLCNLYRAMHGLNKCIDIKAKSRYKKIWQCEGTLLRQVFIKVCRLEIQSVMLVFSTHLCELLPLKPSFWFNFPPLPCIKVQYIQTVCGLEGVGVVESCWRPYPAEVLHSVSEQIHTDKIARPPHTKTMERRGPQTDKHLPQSPCTGQSF